MEGNQDGPCYANNTCESGLSCKNDVCVSAPVGTPGGLCYPNETCDPGVECIEKLCVGPDEDSTVSPDAQPSFTCNNDSEIEPNESVGNPTMTGISSQALSIELAALAICPTADKDVFSFDVAQSGTDALIEIEYQASLGGLTLEILNGTGNSIMSASPVGGNDNLLRATGTNLPTGIYYAQVSADESETENNYSIRIVTTP